MRLFGFIDTLGGLLFCPAAAFHTRMRVERYTSEGDPDYNASIGVFLRGYGVYLISCIFFILSYLWSFSGGGCRGRSLVYFLSIVIGLEIGSFGGRFFGLSDLMSLLCR